MPALQHVCRPLACSSFHAHTCSAATRLVEGGAGPVPPRLHVFPLWMGVHDASAHSRGGPCAARREHLRGTRRSMRRRSMRLANVTKCWLLNRDFWFIQTSTSCSAIGDKTRKLHRLQDHEKPLKADYQRGQVWISKGFWFISLSWQPCVCLRVQGVFFDNQVGRPHSLYLRRFL